MVAMAAAQQVNLVFVYDGDRVGADFFGLDLPRGGNIELAQEMTIRAEELHGSPAIGRLDL
jgi:hypothetical protein